MTDSAVPDPDEADVLGDDRPSPAEARQALRKLRAVFSENQTARVDQIETRLDDEQVRTRDVSDVLAEAFVRRQKKDDHVAQAIAPSVESALKDSVQRNPEALADALFPVMGPAIRRAIQDTFSRLVDSIQKTLEHSFSPQSFRWRFEAWRTGKPYAEIVLSNTLLYRVEQVFLIHRETGLILSQVAIDPEMLTDGDMYSAMITALQDFSRDFDHAGEDDHSDERLRSFIVGDLTVWAESGPQAVIAAAIRGTPRINVRERLQTALETIHADSTAALASFEGDATPFELSRSALETCLVEAGQERRDQSEAQAKKKRLAWMIGLLIVAGLGTWAFFHHRETTRRRTLVTALERAEGIVVTEAREVDGRFLIRGLFKRDVIDLDEHVRGSGLDRDDVDLRFHPLRRVVPEQVVAKFRERTAADERIVTTWRDGVVVLTGRATPVWLDRARLITEGMADIDELDVSSLEVAPEEATQRRRALVAELVAAPGIVVTSSTTTDDDMFVINGLRDPLAADVDTFLAKTDVDPHRVQAEFASYYSTEPAIVRERVRLLLAAPKSVDIEIHDATLVVSGEATYLFRQRLDARAPAIPGIATVDTDGLYERDTVAFVSLRERIEDFPIYFDSASHDIRDTEVDKVGVTTRNIVAILELAQTMKVPVTIEVIGHSDVLDDPREEARLSRRRAETLVGVIADAGADRTHLRATGRRSDQLLVVEATSNEERQPNHRATFRVVSPVSRSASSPKRDR